MKLKLLVFVVGFANAMELPETKESEKLNKSDASITVEASPRLTALKRSLSKEMAKDSFRILEHTYSVPQYSVGVANRNDNFLAWRKRYKDSLDELTELLKTGKLNLEEVLDQFKAYRELYKAIGCENDGLLAEFEIKLKELRKDFIIEIGPLIERKLVDHEEKRGANSADYMKFCNLVAAITLGLVNTGLIAYLVHNAQ